MKELKLILPKEIPPKPVWMDQMEAVLHKQWMEILELEYLETAGKGYKATGIITPNSKKKEEWLSSCSNLPNITLIKS